MTSKFAIDYNNVIGMDFMIYGFDNHMTKDEFLRMKSIAESERKSIAMTVIEAGSEVPCKLRHRTTLRISEEAAIKNSEKLIEKLIFVTEPLLSTPEGEDEERSEKQKQILVQSAAFLLDYLIETYQKLDLQILTIVPDGSSPDDCDELTFGCAMMITEFPNGSINIETVLIMPNILPFFWENGQIIYDTERKHPITDEYLRGIIRLIHPFIPVNLTEKMEPLYSVFGFSTDEITEPFMSDLNEDDIYVPYVENIVGPSLVYSMREGGFFCAAVPHALLSGTENVDIDIDQDILDICASFDPFADSDDGEEEDGEDDEEDDEEEEDESDGEEEDTESAKPHTMN